MSSKDATKHFVPGVKPNEPVNNQFIPSGSELILQGNATAKHLRLPAQDGGFLSQLAKNPFFTAVCVSVWVHLTQLTC
jgi:hypothetical protein